MLLFAIIFLWTPPHFWALSLYRTDDFVRAKLPMLPVVAGPDATRLQILLYTIVLIARCDRAVAARLLRSRLWHCRDRRRRGDALVSPSRSIASARAQPAEAAARNLFSFSIVYLFVLFATLLIDALAPLAMRIAGWSMITAMDKKDEPDGIVLTEQQLRSRRQRSIAIAVILVALVVLFFVVTLVKGPAVLIRPI